MFDVVPGRSRLFTFGCSFTDYVWTTWPQILGHHYKIPLYNYGQTGAGNMYIFNHIMQADCYYTFQPEDIIAVCWTNVCREDRYVDGGWCTEGNIFTNDQFEKDWVKRWVDPDGMSIRDLAAIKAAHEFVFSKTKNHLFLSMCDLINRKDQWAESNTKPNDRISRLYRTTLDQIRPSFYDTLWNDNPSVKQIKDYQEVHKKFIDGHPSPVEGLEYLQAVTDIEFGTSTIDAVEKSQQFWRDFLIERKISRPWSMAKEEIAQLELGTKIWPTEKISRL
jgi:hypothetical protein